MNVPAHTDALFRQAERGVLPLGELFQGAQTMVELGMPLEAIRLYEAWIAHTTSPAVYAACFNLAVARGNVGDAAGAERDYLKAIALAPGFVEARLNLGTLYERMNRPDDALAAWQGILADVPDLANKPVLHVQTLNNLGRLCEMRKRLPEALACAA